MDIEMFEEFDAVRRALDSLGVCGVVCIFKKSEFIVSVHVDGQYFGLFDTKCNTFVE